MLFRFAPCGEALIPAIEPLLRTPGVLLREVGRVDVPAPQLLANEGMVAIVPRGFDEDPAEMRIAGFGDRAARASSRWNAPTGSSRRRPSGRGPSESAGRHPIRRRWSAP